MLNVESLLGISNVKSMLTADIYDKALNLIGLPVVDDHIVRFNEGT